MLHKFFEAYVEHIAHHALGKVQYQIVHIVLGFVGDSLVLHHVLDAYVGLLLVGGNGHNGFLVVAHGEVDALGGVGRHFDA